MKKYTFALLLASLSAAPEALAGSGGDEFETSRPPGLEDVFVDTFFMDKNIGSGRLTIGAATSAGDIGVIFDRATDAVYVSANGMQSSYSINTIASSYYSNSPGDAAALAGNLRGYLSSELGLAAYRLAGDNFLGRGGRIDEIGGPNLGAACSLSPCGAQWGNGYGTNFWGVYYTPHRDPTYGGYSPDVIAFDRGNFDAESRRDCERAKQVAAGVGFQVGATLFSCGLSATGVGAAGCAIGLGALGKDVADKMEGDTCGQPYPGPGKWTP